MECWTLFLEEILFIKFNLFVVAIAFGDIRNLAVVDSSISKHGVAAKRVVFHAIERSGRKAGVCGGVVDIGVGAVA